MASSPRAQSDVSSPRTGLSSQGSSQHPDTPEGRLRRRASELEKIGLLELDDKGKVRAVASTISQGCADDNVATFGLHLLLSGLENMRIAESEDLASENKRLRKENEGLRSELRALKQRVAVGSQMADFGVSDAELTDLAGFLQGEWG